MPCGVFGKPQWEGHNLDQNLDSGTKSCHMQWRITYILKTAPDMLLCPGRDGIHGHRTSNDHASDHTTRTAHYELSSVRSSKV